jgi:hypothetical protein
MSARRLVSVGSVPPAPSPCPAGCSATADPGGFAGTRGDRHLAP